MIDPVIRISLYTQYSCATSPVFTFSLLCFTVYACLSSSFSILIPSLSKARFLLRSEIQGSRSASIVLSVSIPLSPRVYGWSLCRLASLRWIYTRPRCVPTPRTCERTLALRPNARVGADPISLARRLRKRGKSGTRRRGMRHCPAILWDSISGCTKSTARWIFFMKNSTTIRLICINTVIRLDQLINYILIACYIKISPYVSYFHSKILVLSLGEK